MKSLLPRLAKGVTFLIGVDTSSNQVIGQCHPEEVIMTSHASRSGGQHRTLDTWPHAQPANLELNPEETLDKPQ